MAMLDNGLECAEKRLVEKRVAELKGRAKEIERQLPIITPRLGILWSEVTGSSRPVPSEMQLTSTGTEMSEEEHVVTTETHLRYAEGHLQPSEEHLADAEVHLKLVKAHLAALEAVEAAEVGSLEKVSPPPIESPIGEIGTGRAAPREAPMDRAEVVLAGEERNPSGKLKVGLAQRGRKPSGGAEDQTSCWMRPALATWQSTSEPDGEAKRRSEAGADARSVDSGMGS